MENDANNLYCPNDLCQAPNGQNDKFCQQCGTPMLKRYLWAQGKGIEAYTPGNLWRDRYLVKSQRIFLDTKPSLPPEAPEVEIPDRIKHYLRLVPHRLHLPQLYAVVPEEGQDTEILLLEQAPIYSNDLPNAGQLMPKLSDIWGNATSMRQLNWLWQIANLWQPLASEGVASSLLEPELLRVEGSLVRLLELLPGATPSLSALGQMWLPWVSQAKPAIAGFLTKLCKALIEAQIHSDEQLIAVLDRGIATIGHSQTCSLKITTHTDAGPSRKGNEDACYPPSGSNIQTSDTSEALVIVCDGIGGHEGGNVASNLAIETIQQLQSVLVHNRLDSASLIDNLERAACDANDQISRRNDSEHRHGRQRMGTTLVMSLVQAHEIYITHVGDSRAYWITRAGCHQVTLDDDVASREVRLGYALYQDALQQVSSGSLVQALGMSSSASLHPTVQRFMLDEDCVFLLCSDGLSDYDRVEQSWETEILPILNGKDVATVGVRLVEIANTQNGHDNVTVGLVHCQVSFSEPSDTSLLQQIAIPPDIHPPSSSNPANNDTQEPTYAPTTLQTEILPSEYNKKRSFLPIILGIILLLGLGGLLAYYLVPGVSSTFPPLAGSSSSPKPSLPIASTPAIPPPSPDLQVREITNNNRVKFYHGKPQQRQYRLLSKGAIVKIVEERKEPPSTGKQKETLLPVEICSEPNPSSVGIDKLGQTNSNNSGNESSSTATPKLLGRIDRKDIEENTKPTTSDKCLISSSITSSSSSSDDKTIVPSQQPPSPVSTAPSSAHPTQAGQHF